MAGGGTTLSHLLCPACRERLGYFRPSGDFYVTGSGVLVERTRNGAILHCPCGRKLTPNGRRTIIAETLLEVQRDVV
jgi:hypothetical protein